MTTALNAVAVYARYSTDRQDARSIDDQLRRCRAFAEQHQLDVVAEYRDAAQSGASLDRADMQRMLADARRKGGPSFRAVLVDDLSRLSRDAGDAWRVIFQDLAGVRVRVIDCNTGMASDGAGARLAFGAMALVNDTFLQLVKTETHRGLEGRARDGFHTGGRCYGYWTEREPNPADPEHPRAIVRVQPDEAAVVLRVFREYVAGQSLGAIASALNADGIRAPYDALEYEKPAGRGWAKNQIHALLRNERYVGRVVWNRREFFLDPVSKKRRSRLRPEKEWVRFDAPEQRIVPDDLWTAAQERHGTRTGGRRGRPRDSGKRPHLLTGLLRCGSCGSGMSIVGTRWKNGVPYASYGCSANRSKGDAICPNAATVSERRADAAVLQGLVEYVESGRFEAWLFEAIRDEQAASERDKSAELMEAEAAVRKQQGKVEKVGRLLLDNAASEYLRATLKQEEERLRALRQTLATVVRAQPAPAEKLDVARVEGVMRDLAAVAAHDAVEARRVLSEVVESIVLKLADGGYVAEVTLKNETAAIAGGRVLEKTGCGGRI